MDRPFGFIVLAATPALGFSGALVCMAMTQFELPFAQWAGVSAALAVRSLGIIKGLSLPQARAKE